jgi:hypothetical protein
VGSLGEHPFRATSHFAGFAGSLAAVRGTRARRPDILSALRVRGILASHPALRAGLIHVPAAATRLVATVARKGRSPSEPTVTTTFARSHFAKSARGR